jgi:chemosensory pili system protein ChpA (sensor histidine kinase/response regulator)
VDDSITMRKVNSRVLDGEDFETITAKDGQDAVDQMQDRIPDILLLDIEMPRMDGYQLAEYVRGDARLRDIPIIMITSRSGKKHRDRAAQAGANAYLTKPYKETELIATVNRLLGRKES